MKIKVVFFDLGETLVTQNRKWVAGAKATLAALAGKGLRLGIISNTLNMTREQVKERLPTDFDFNIFEKELVILSSEVGVEKPDLQIFQLAVDKTKIKAAECLFCTEETVHTLAAQQIGMKALRLPLPPQSDIGKLLDNLKSAKLIE